MKPRTNSPIRKRLLPEAGVLETTSEVELNIADGATIAYSSEDAAYPVDNMFDGRDGRGGTFWASGRTDAAETLLIEFDTPQTISRIIFQAEERKDARTQEVRIEVSEDGGATFRGVLVQEYVFSPHGATFQHEDLRIGVDGATHLRLTIVPNKSGTGRASLTSLRLFG